MSMAPVAAAISGNSSGATKSKIQSIAWPGPAMKPSSDIDLFTTTLPFPVLVSLILFLSSVPSCYRACSPATRSRSWETTPPLSQCGLRDARCAHSTQREPRAPRPGRWWRTGLPGSSIAIRADIAAHAAAQRALACSPPGTENGIESQRRPRGRPILIADIRWDTLPRRRQPRVAPGLQIPVETLISGWPGGDDLGQSPPGAVQGVIGGPASSDPGTP